MHRAACLAFLALACQGEPAATEPSAPPPLTDAPAAPEPAPPTLPTEPALHSWTGQATHQGIGLWRAFYPLGWSPDGRFAWVDERRVNDMALEHVMSWRVVDAGGQRGLVSWEATHQGDAPGLARGWSERGAELDALFREHGIAAAGTDLAPFPVDTPHGLLDASWQTHPLSELEQRATLTLTWPDGREQALHDGTIPSMPGPPAAPVLIPSPTGAHAAVVAPVVVTEPVEALVDVRYLVFVVDLHAGETSPP